MERLIYVPQYPAKMRYSEWWLPEFYTEFKKIYDEVIVLGTNYLSKHNNDKSYNTEMFSPINRAMKFETSQMNDYMSLDIRDDDTLFLADISFPGVFCNVLYHRPCPKMYAFCHATSLNKYDYFMPMRQYKKKIEFEHARLFNKIFFGSQYSIDKTGWHNRYIDCKNVALPDSPSNLIYNTGEEKSIDIVSVCRPSIQKVNKRTEKKVEKALGIKIHREEVNSWEEYSSLLTRSKILLVSSKEDTFNLTILDAIRCGCIPIVPNTLCFPEILETPWRYNDVEHLISILSNIIIFDQLSIPEIKCKNKVDNFFEDLCDEMRYL